MTGNEIREKFLKFFESKGHKILPSASLIPATDPTLLWTAAGMVPFKPFFTGEAKPDFRRVTTCQKCIRTGDIESVGRTARHHTFFEMLGNFSFGDYFKKEAIGWAWEFTTEVLQFPKDKLWVSIYTDDDEAFQIWHQEIGVPADRIVRLGKDTNFWEIGTGPCGPCSEIHIDLGPERGCDSPTCGVGCDCDRFLEFWNLVFIQFYRDEEGNYTPLTNPGIDTGMGLERVASIVQGVNSNFETDLLMDVMTYTASLLQVKYGVSDKTDWALKVIADHTRAITFAISDGALPSNEGRGYVIRRLLRRAVRFGKVLGMDKPFLHQVASAVINMMKDAYPDLAEKGDHIMKVIKAEEERFGETLAQGINLLDQVIDRARQEGKEVIDGQDVFKLYDTYGFPLELTREMVEEQGLTVDLAGFEAALEEQRTRARAARQETEYISERGTFYAKLLAELGETNFVGYEAKEATGKVLAIVKDQAKVAEAGAGEEVEIIFDTTPGYAESGGQVKDTGTIEGAGFRAAILDLTKPAEGLFVHKVRITDGKVGVGDEAKIAIDGQRRKAIARNHTATHLLHKALKEVLGGHVNQAGSLVEPDKLRFDFTHFAAVTPEQLDQIEQLVNAKILESLPVETVITSVEEARAQGATALFGEKYGEKVRLVKMGDFSKELCGGTHLRNTSEVGLFKLVSEGGVGAGLRRIEAVTGEGALQYIAQREEILKEIAGLVKGNPNDAAQRVGSLLQALREKEKEVEHLRSQLARYEAEGLLGQVREVSGVKVLAARVSAPDMEALRSMADLFRNKLGAGVIVLGSVSGEKVNLVATATKDLLGKGIHAGNIIKEVARITGGGGGGRPDMAQAGGKNPAKLEEALAQVAGLVAAQLGH